MLIMLVDHVRERFYLHMQVSDPMNPDTTAPELFWTRTSAHLCAPVFVFLTGLSAWLYAQNGRPLTGFLLKRGLFLIALEFTLVTFSWMGTYHTIWLQVMWAIGLSMIALALLHRLPRHWLALIGLLLIAGHNALTPIQFQPHEWGYSLWTILHDRGYLIQSPLIQIKISYPLLPWIGVILLGYVAGPLYTLPAGERKTWLLRGALLYAGLFILLRGFNLYGETLPWHIYPDIQHSLMSLFSLTKYPPSLNFLLLTLGLGLLLLWLLESRVINTRAGRYSEHILCQFGGAPLFFYLLHLYSLLLMYQLALLYWQPNHGDLLGVPHIGWVWLIAALLALALYPPTRAFAALKKRSRHPLLSYF